jgi:hypothetical protein
LRDLFQRHRSGAKEPLQFGYSPVASPDTARVCHHPIDGDGDNCIFASVRDLCQQTDDFRAHGAEAPARPCETLS